MVPVSSQRAMVKTHCKHMAGILPRRMLGTLMDGTQKDGDGTIMNNYDKLYVV